MIEITATGDTTLHTAGKYCPEDILVKVPAGGSGGAAVETLTVRLSTSSMMMDYIDGTLYCTVLDSTGAINISQAYTGDMTASMGVTIDNVLVGSLVLVVMDSSIGSIYIGGEGELLYSSSDMKTFIIRPDAASEGDGNFTIGPSDL